MERYRTSLCSSPRSVALSSCRSCRWSSPWSRCPPCWRRPRWRSCRRSGRGRTSCPHCCCQWSAAWTCSRSSGRLSPSGPASPARPPGLRLQPSAHSKHRAGAPLVHWELLQSLIGHWIWHQVMSLYIASDQLVMTVEQGHCLQTGGSNLCS